MSAKFPGISLHVQVTIAPENVPRYLELMKPVFDKVIQEPECTFFELYQDPEKPGVLKWVENWTKDVQWLMTEQVTKAYYKEYLDETTPMWLEPRKAEIYQRMSDRSWTMVKPSNQEL